MGNASFLLGTSGGGTYNNLFEAIEKLRDCSDAFLARMSRNDRLGASKKTETAFECFDYIVGQFIRERDQRVQDFTYQNTAFGNAMSVITSLHLKPFSAADRSTLTALGPGNGRMPAGSAPIPIDLERTLNKIKHRRPWVMNYRVDNGRHIFLICPLNPDECTEFDVNTFCDNCMNAAHAL